MELLSGDGFSRIESDTSGLVDGKSAGLHYGCAAVADCFHRMRLSGEIRNFFCWPGVSNKYLKRTEVEGTQVSVQSNSLADVLLVTNAQSTNRTRLNRQPSLHCSVEMTDRGPSHVLGGPGQMAQTGHWQSGCLLLNLTARSPFSFGATLIDAVSIPLVSTSVIV